MVFWKNDVRTLETICFLKELGISLKDIAAILHSDESKEVIALLLERRATDLGKEIAEKLCTSVHCATHHLNRRSWRHSLPDILQKHVSWPIW
jgi:DNA-binding transcriptional MerR regulator